MNEELISMIDKLCNLSEEKFDEIVSNRSLILGQDDMTNIVWASIEGIYQNGIVFTIANDTCTPAARYDYAWGYHIIMQDGFEPKIIYSLSGTGHILKNENEEEIEVAKKELGQSIDTKYLEIKYKEDFINKIKKSLELNKLKLIVSKYIDQLREMLENKKTK